MAIFCYDGLLGQGKTYGMVDEAVEHVKKHRGTMVYTNMAGLKFPEACYFDHIEELCDISSGLVLLDEAMIVVPSRFWADTGRDLLARFAQLRKHGLDLWYTAQLADGVDKVLRELTNEVVTCTKWGKFFKRSRSVPSRKMGLGSRLRPFRPAIGALYDTLETISTTGGSAGLPGLAARQSTVARKRSEDDRAMAAVKAKQGVYPIVRYRHLSQLDPHGRKMDLTPPAREALEWLQKEGHWRAEEPWSQQLRREMKRRNWLRLFGLGPEDAPVDCTPAWPWLEGFDPRSVKARRAELEVGRAAEKLVLAREKRNSGRSFTTS